MASIVHFLHMSAATLRCARTVVQGVPVRSGHVWGVWGAQAAHRRLTQGKSAAGPVAGLIVARLYACSRDRVVGLTKGKSLHAK